MSMERVIAPARSTSQVVYRATEATGLESVLIMTKELLGHQLVLLLTKQLGEGGHLGEITFKRHSSIQAVYSPNPRKRPSRY